MGEKHHIHYGHSIDGLQYYRTANVDRINTLAEVSAGGS